MFIQRWFLNFKEKHFHVLMCSFVCCRQTWMCKVLLNVFNNNAKTTQVVAVLCLSSWRETNYYTRLSANCWCHGFLAKFVSVRFFSQLSAFDGAMFSLLLRLNRQSAPGAYVFVKLILSKYFLVDMLQFAVVFESPNLIW